MLSTSLVLICIFLRNLEVNYVKIIIMQFLNVYFHCSKKNMEYKKHYNNRVNSWLFASHYYSPYRVGWANRDYYIHITIKLRPKEKE